MEAVTDDRVEPVAQAGRAHGRDRDRDERAAHEHGHGRKSAPALAPEQVHDGSQPGVEGRLLDQQRDPGQRAGSGET